MGNEQFKRFSSEMSEQRQKTNELQQELEESTQKHQQLIQSRELVCKLYHSKRHILFLPSIPIAHQQAEATGGPTGQLPNEVQTRFVYSRKFPQNPCR
jgi:oligoendopeptidase F